MRIFTIVLDSFGIGAADDAIQFGDAGCSTIKSISKSEYFNVDNLKKLGLLNIGGVNLEKENDYIGSFARLKELSNGKDTTTGHWEMAGIVSKKPFPTFPNGFPSEVIEEFEKQTGRKAIVNKPYSGTKVIEDYGKESVETDSLIVYTSADSVFQIAAHEDVVDVETLYDYCKIARKILKGDYGVGRVIARPFAGDEGNYYRTTRRHDFSLEPTSDTVLDILERNGKDTIAVGKIYDIFAHRGMSEHYFTEGNTQGIEKTLEIAKTKDFDGLCFANLVDTDMYYGHRRDIDGYAKAISEFDKSIPSLIDAMKAEDVLIITADHGCDPGFKGTDHTREDVPLLIYSKSLKSNNLGIINGFGVVGKTICSLLKVDGAKLSGEDIYERLINE